jgi:hypothetical protein
MPNASKGQWRLAESIACAVYLDQIATGEIQDLRVPRRAEFGNGQPARQRGREGPCRWPDGCAPAGDRAAGAGTRCEIAPVRSDRTPSGR